MKFAIIVLFFSFFISCTTYQGPLHFKTKSRIFYTNKNSERQMGEIYLPEGEGPFPGVILVHGGGWSSRNLEDMRSIGKSLVTHGFTVFNINYRLSPEFRHPSAVNDVESAYKFFIAGSREFKLDPERIGLWGYSSGGHLVSFYALTHTDKLRPKAVVAGGTPFDFTWYPHSPYIKKYLGNYRDEMMDQYIDASPASHVTRGQPPFFLYHAINDSLVEHAQSTAFEAKLIQNGVEVERYDIHFWDHGPAFIFSGEAVEHGVQFLIKKLVNGTTST